MGLPWILSFLVPWGPWLNQADHGSLLGGWHHCWSAPHHRQRLHHWQTWVSEPSLCYSSCLDEAYHVPTSSISLYMNVNIWLNYLPESHCSGTTMWSCSPSLFTAFAFLATPSSTHPWSPFSLRWCKSWITQWQWRGVQRSVILPIISLSRRTKDIDLQVLKPFGNSLLMIAAMTYAKNNADISTMASLEVTWFSKGIGCNL